MVLRYNPPPEQFERVREPVFNRFPAVVLFLSAVIIGASLIQFMAQSNLIFTPRLADWMFSVGALAGGPEYANVYRPWGDWPSLVLHVLLHGGIFHLAMNMTAMIAFGPPIAMAFGRQMSGAAGFLIFFALCAVTGGLAQLGWFELAGDSGLAIGASSALSGFLPAVGYLQGGRAQAVRISIPWLIINLVLAVSTFAFPLPIAWAAHLGGLAGGFVLFPLILRMFNPDLAARF
ncbi:rhomboid family intramembrane serine protease [Henriciella aquimarina]|uniref:rhomboid family intramembrane serine protease n=1 Tax=Henriciella aquimarina TaxID=545261 RepID=UPI000A06D8D1|nr:rhomboid family intramembrane serine protease [Henriciella aquimarina]